MLHLEDWSEGSFAQQTHLVKCLLLPTRLNEWPNLLGLRHDIIFRSFRRFHFMLLLFELHDLNLADAEIWDTSRWCRCLHCRHQTKRSSGWAVRLVTHSLPNLAAWAVLYFNHSFWCVSTFKFINVSSTRRCTWMRFSSCGLLWLNR